MTENTEDKILEALGYDEMTGLKNPKGEDLGLIKVPRLPGFATLKFQKRVFDQFMKVADLQPKEVKEGEVPDPKLMMEVLDKIYDDEGLQLMVDILTRTFGMTEESLELRFDYKSLTRLHAFIVKRDFDVQDLVESFLSRFSEMFGGGETADSPTTPPPAS